MWVCVAEAFGTTTWSKQYCTYEKGSRTLALTPYNQINVKTVSSTTSISIDMPSCPHLIIVPSLGKTGPYFWNSLCCQSIYLSDPFSTNLLV